MDIDEARFTLIEDLIYPQMLDVRVIVDAPSNLGLQTQWIYFDLKQHGIEVQGGVEDVWDELLSEIENLQTKGIKIWITGHSLGAALAADRLKTAQGLYTFGSPRVRYQTFKARFRTKTFRIVNADNIVPSILPAGFFQHVGEFSWSAK